MFYLATPHAVMCVANPVRRDLALYLSGGNPSATHDAFTAFLTIWAVTTFLSNCPGAPLVCHDSANNHPFHKILQQLPLNLTPSPNRPCLL